MLIIKLSKNSPQWIKDVHLEHCIEWIGFLIEMATNRADDIRILGKETVERLDREAASQSPLIHPNCKSTYELL